MRGPRPPSHQWPRADVQRKRQPHAPVGIGSERQLGSPVSLSHQHLSPQPSNVLHVSKSPDEVWKCAFSKVARFQAAIASLDEDDQVIFAAGSQTRPAIDYSCTCRSTHRRFQFIERAKKRVQSAEADVKKAVEAQRLREGEFALEFRMNRVTSKSGATPDEAV